MRKLPYFVVAVLVLITISFVRAVENSPEDNKQAENTVEENEETENTPEDSIPDEEPVIEKLPTHLNIFYTDSLGVERVHSAALKDIGGITFGRCDTTNDYSDILIDSTRVSMDSVKSYQLGTNVPLIRIYTDSVVNDVFSKEIYLSGYATLEGYGHYEDLDSTSLGIRGRGNTSWVEPKKPYRLKFSKKQSLCGLAAAKSFVLIANYIDATHSRNAFAFKLSQLLEMPYANHSIPVNVEFNGIPKGAYMLSEKIGIGKGSVNIDELTGIMWELDANYDEDYKFMSPIYNLPVMLADPDPEDILEELNNKLFPPEEPEEPGEEVKDPENPEETGEEIKESESSEETGAEVKGFENQEGFGEELREPEKAEEPNDSVPERLTAEEWFENWKDDFIRMEQSVKNGTPEETIDLNQLVDYVLVFLVTGNNDIDWPKSVKLYKQDKDSLYVFGTGGEFVWGYGYA